jgi:knotted carbamoyltransferase YgeW
MLHEHIKTKIDLLSKTPNELHDQDVLLTWNLSDASIRGILLAAEILEDVHRAGLSSRVYESGLGVSIFRDNSTRTRYAFRSGCNLVGLATEELDESTSQIAHGETVRETAAMISFLTEVVGIRDDMYLGEGHKYMLEVGEALEEARREGVIHHRPAVLNLQSDLDHPTQSMSDLLHLSKVFGGLDALRGKKLAMTWAHSPSYGKPLSVPQGAVALMTRFGMHVALAHPQGYDLVDEPIQAARRFASESSGTFRTVESMDEAFEQADIVYPKSWAPRHIMEERAELFREGRHGKLHKLEKKALVENAKHRDWECSKKMMKSTRDEKALYMHCLPADVSDVSCEAGEVSKAVFEQARLDTYRQASHKPYIVAAMILATRFRETASVLWEMLDRGRARRPL